MPKIPKPLILAPAGDVDSFLAAVAAGADAVYCGLKIFSARMEAGNFSIEELSRLNALARSKGVKVYVTLNSLIKQNELVKTQRIIQKLDKYVHPHALILQDPGLIHVARKSGFKGELHLSTLANCSFPAALDAVKKVGFNRVVLPRELSIDEIKIMAAHRPSGLDLEVFIHGALCYGVSGRCYWSSWFGGRSGLRGRCVQPCRRMYRQKAMKQRFFSCLDFSADVLVKVLKEIPEVTTWKIEGRKKSPHYVFYTVRAYKLLRDQGHDPRQKKTALAFLDYAMGRPFTHYNLLSQRPQNPLKKDVETGSGLFAGRIKLGENPHLITREPLFRDDLLRIGYEDDKGHAILRVTRSVPKKGKLVLQKGKKGKIVKGTPVFIVDRREKEIKILIDELGAELKKYSSPDVMPFVAESEGISVKREVKKEQKSRFYAVEESQTHFQDLHLCRKKAKGRIQGRKGEWLPKNELRKMSGKTAKSTWWFLPPVVWPGEENALIANVNLVRSLGGRKFVLNIPWQISLFEDKKNLDLWAGPFCNVANLLHVNVLKNAGFSGVIVSPELNEEDFMRLPDVSSLPLGVVLNGNWPLAISRIVSQEIGRDRFFASPMKENAWVSKIEGDYWVFPGWKLDLNDKKQMLINAGYTLFLNMEETVPKGEILKKRPGLWNWQLKLL